MAPTALEKAEKDRLIQRTEISVYCDRFTSHTTRPLSQIEVNHYIKKLGLLSTAVLENQHKILMCAPENVGPYEVECKTMMTEILRLECDFGALVVSNTGGSSSSTSSGSAGNVPDIRLPRLELPKFDGDISEWMTFKDIFTSAVHNNSKISDVQKLTYLKSSLTGNASKLLTSMAATDANYAIAWRTLEDRFQNERQLVFSVLKRLLGQPATKTDSANGLRSLVDVSKECFRSLETLVPTTADHRDILFMFIMLEKADAETKKEWELSLPNTAVPKLSDFLAFMEQRARGLESSLSCKQTGQGSKKAFVHHADQNICKICSGPHFAFKCQTFLDMNVAERRDIVKKQGLCFSCLKSGHNASKCDSTWKCKTCKERHHSLLHIEKKSSAPESPAPAVGIFHVDEGNVGHGLLATALVKIMDKFNQPRLCRAFLDGGSTTSFITESCVKKLGLGRQWTSCDIKGLADASLGRSKGQVTVDIHPYFHIPGDDKFSLTMLVMSSLTNRLPSQHCTPEIWPHLEGIQLADPAFHKSSKVDILIGADLFWDILMDGRKTGPEGTPTGFRSRLGWLVAGSTSLKSPQALVHHVDVDLDARLQKFWELEPVSDTRVFTKEEKRCEEHFSSTVKRDDIGRYIVSLPFKDVKQDLGASRDIAMRRLLSLERRLNRFPQWRTQYVDFMKEYEDLGHMIRVTPDVVKSERSPMGKYYIPHHFVLKESSTSTKFRVVFDASSKTAAGISLNEKLMVGPTIQDNMTDILMRFRTHPIAFTADIKKMYRQIRVAETDADWQRILWRDDPKKEVMEYRLLTVTYGTASAPFHATRALQQLADDEQDSLPLAAAVARRDFYVDDLQGGEETVEKALAVQKELMELTRRGGFELCKWVSNHPDLLSSLDPKLRETQLPLSMDKDDMVKTLGLHWNPGLDVFTFKVQLPTMKSTVITKRLFLSEVAKVFDPLGWLGPIVIRAKIMFQEMWQAKIDWDDELPTHIRVAWMSFRENLPCIEELSIDRCVIPMGSLEFSLLGFCDASERAYAAVVYVKAETACGEVKISLTAAKTRVAPTKKITLPRLELCGALLLADLMKTVEDAQKIKFHHTIAWSDSTTVLAWIHGESSRWKTFVANRVNEIQEKFVGTWHHVSGVENPADCASRGIDPAELKNHKLWWQGPDWLKRKIILNQQTWDESNEDVIAEERRQIICAATEVSDEMPFLQDSSLMKIQTKTAWCLRFIFNCRVCTRRTTTGSVEIDNPLRKGQLSPEELDEALLTWVKVVQRSEFHDEVGKLKSGLTISNKSKLRKMNPFLDEKGLLRVGGRIRNAPVCTDQRNPMMLPRHHRLTLLIIQNEHERLLHGGTQLLLATIQKRFWIIGAKDAIRQHVRKCVTCTRHRATTMQQFMGDLPAVRITPTRPFLTCGLDYAGPFVVRAIPGRSKVTFKAYLALFICFCTRAVHLEVVSSMTTEACLAALRRFVARRGRPSNIHSDCGTNFVGAARELKEFLATIKSEDHNRIIGRYLATEGIQWHFNPPGAPHFGGLWEAGVKSAKFHLHRVIGSARLTFEELTTTITQIEACLNSRPLTPCSTDPDDLTALTPGHFLIGDSLMAIPEPDLTMEKVNRLSRWQLTQQMAQHFWKRWHMEYLARLQQRPKWLKHRTEVKVGDMVLVKEDNLAPLKWQLARVVAVHPGPDGLIRVATLKTAGGELKRPIVKLCLLPIDSSVSEIDNK